MRHAIVRSRFIKLASAMTLAVVASGCTNATPSRSPAAAAPVLADVLTYKGGMDRLGTNAGPGPADQPIVLWSVDAAVGVNASPLVAGGLLIAADQGGTVRAIDAETGSEVWSLTLPAGVATTPTIANGSLYLITNDGTLRSFALADRKPGWTAAGFLPESIITVTADRVLAGAAGELVALDASDGAEMWRIPAPGSDRSAVAGDVVLVSGTGSGRIAALKLADGSERWSFETSTESVLTPALIDGTVVVAARDIASGRNIVYALDDSGHELWHAAGPDIIGATSVVGDQVLVAIDDPETGVTAYNRSNGQVVWRRSLGGALIGIPVVADGRVYVAGNEEGLVAIDAAAGGVIWRADLGSVGKANLAVSGGLAFVTTRDADGGGRILALAAASDARASQAAITSSHPTNAPTEALAPVSILSVDPIEGSSLLLSTAVAPDGTMYVGDMRNSRIVVRAPDGTIESWGEFGSGPGQFNFNEVTRNDGSVGVAVSPDGSLIAVGDGGNHRVQLFDGDRTFLRSFGRLGREDGQFINPCCVSVDAEHRIWVVDTARADIQVFSEKGKHLLTFGEAGHGAGQLNRPSAAFVDAPNHTTYVPDFGNRRVAVFTTEGKWIRAYGGELAPGVRLDETNFVVLDTFGRLLILDTTSRIFVLDQSGNFVGSIGNPLPGIGSVDVASFAVDDKGRLYFADIGNERAGRLVIAQLEPPLWPQ